jgi:hypothetical protein
MPVLQAFGGKLQFLRLGSQLQSVLGKFSPGKKAALRFQGRFHDVKQRRREIPPRAAGTGGTLRPRTGGPIHPSKAPVMIRNPSGRDLSHLANRNKNVKG